MIITLHGGAQPVKYLQVLSRGRKPHVMWYFQFSIQDVLAKDYLAGRLPELSATITRFREILPDVVKQVVVECDAVEYCEDGIEVFHQIRTHDGLGTSPLHVRLSMPIEDANARLAQLSAYAIVTQLRDVADREHLMGFHFDGIMPHQFSYHVETWKANQRQHGGLSKTHSYFASP